MEVSTEPKKILEVRLSGPKRVMARVADAEFPIELKDRTEALAQREGPDRFRIITAYGQGTAESVVGRSDLIFG